MTKEELEKRFKELYPPNTERKIVMYTGVGGADLVQESFEKELKFERIYIPNKLLRLVKKTKAPFLRGA